MNKLMLAPLLAALMLPLGALAQTEEEASPAPQTLVTSTPTTLPTHHRRHHHGMTPSPTETGDLAKPQAMQTPRNKTQRFITETAAQAECPNDTVVWMNTRSHVIHHKGDQYYGKTKSGSYVCEHAK